MQGAVRITFRSNREITKSLSAAHKELGINLLLLGPEAEGTWFRK
jgi:hypothetical protein